jgi:hypothetical protein
MRSKLFHLKRNGELLAVLEACRPHDEMFWDICDFKPNDAFADVESLFREASETEDMEIFDRNYDKLIEMGVILLDVEKNIEIRYFMIHIHKDTVNLRYAEPPYLDE